MWLENKNVAIVSGGESNRRFGVKSFYNEWSVEMAYRVNIKKIKRVIIILHLLFFFSSCDDELANLVLHNELKNNKNIKDLSFDENTVELIFNDDFTIVCRIYFPKGVLSIKKYEVHIFLIAIKSKDGKVVNYKYYEYNDYDKEINPYIPCNKWEDQIGCKFSNITDVVNNYGKIKNFLQRIPIVDNLKSNNYYDTPDTVVREEKIKTYDNENRKEKYINVKYKLVSYSYTW
jgi:hypothetical protein